MIEIKNISKSFGDQNIIQNVSAEFQTYDNSLIIGASGTGKSVLLKCIVGLLRPDEGQILYDGRDFLNGKRNVINQIRREIGMLFQGNALFDSLTIEENVRFPLDMRAKHMTAAEKKSRVDESLARVRLDNIHNLMPSELSGGMKKRVALARAVVMRPKYLFCDEPNSGLDPETSIVIDNLISDITDDYAMTTIIVTHDMNSVVEIGEHIIFIHQGRKLWQGDSDSIIDSDVPELNSFVFANKMMRTFKEVRT